MHFVSSARSWELLCDNPGQVVDTVVPLSPSSITWYQCKTAKVMAVVMPSITPGINSLPAEDYERETSTASTVA